MAIELLIIARAVHVVSVVVWIGGVFFVTFVLLPALNFFPVSERLAVFERLEQRFSLFARISVLLAGISGWILADSLLFWQRLGESRLFPIHLMLLTWGIFFLILFVLEPLVARRLLHGFAQEHPERALAFARYIHIFLSFLSLTTVILGMMMAHGWPF